MEKKTLVVPWKLVVEVEMEEDLVKAISFGEVKKRKWKCKGIV